METKNVGPASDGSTETMPVVEKPDGRFLELSNDSETEPELKTEVAKGLLFKRSEALQVETDYGNARRLHHMFKDDLIHTLDGKWFWWDGTRWVLSSTTQLRPRVVEMIVNIKAVDEPYYKYLQTRLNPEQYDTYCLEEVDAGFVSSCYSVAKQDAALKSSASLLLKDVPFDAHPFLLNVANGTVDLKTGVLLEHDPDNHLTKLCPIDYDAAAQCPRWEAMIKAAFPNDPKGQRYVQKMFGYALTGDIGEKKLFFLWGAAGNNGKSTWINTVLGLLGPDFTASLAITSLSTKNGSKDIRSDLAKLAGKRFVAVAEPDENFKFDESLIKNFTGGDGMNYRHPSQQEKTYAPEFTMIITTNFRPGFKRNDPAMMRRVVIIPCRQSVTEINPNLQRELLDAETGERAGILAWLVAGTRMWAEDGGMGECPFDSSDGRVFVRDVSVEEFIKKCCIREPGVKVKTMDLFAAYNRYRTNVLNDAPEPMSVKDFAMVLDAMGIIRSKFRDGSYTKDIRLVSEVVVETDEDNSESGADDAALKSGSGAVETEQCEKRTVETVNPVMISDAERQMILDERAQAFG